MEVGRVGGSGVERQTFVMNFRSSELTSGKLFPLRRPPTMVGMPERCSPARIRFAALTRVLACSAPFRQISTCDGRLRREHLSDSCSYQWSPRKMLTASAFSWKPDNSGIGPRGARGDSHRCYTLRMPVKEVAYVAETTADPGAPYRSTGG